MALNLARDPFLNLRPVRRVGILFAVLGLVLAVIDARTYWRHFTGENQTRVQLQELDARIAAERQSLSELLDRLSSLEVEALNQRVAFVNKQISQRTFSWSALFDDLVEILPPQAQLLSLQPQFDTGRRSRRELGLRPGEVLLEIDGVARDTARLLSLIDRMFSHPSFRRPDLERESLGNEVIDFTLKVIYRPGAEEAPAGEETPAGESDGAAPAPAPAETVAGGGA